MIEAKIIEAKIIEIFEEERKMYIKALNDQYKPPEELIGIKYMTHSLLMTSRHIEVHTGLKIYSSKDRQELVDCIKKLEERGI